MIRPIQLLFDLDGTLCDPGIGIVRSLNHALIHFGHSARPENELHIHIGPPLDEAFRALTGLTTLDELAPYVTKYRERYFDVGYRENRVYDGIVDTLTRLDEAGTRMAICTSKRTDIAERVVRMFGLRRFFQLVDGGEVGTQKWQQIQALKQQGLVDSKTIMIGDRAVDIETGHRNGLPAAGVLWGYGSRQELESAHPEHLFSQPSELARLISVDH